MKNQKQETSNLYRRIGLTLALVVVVGVMESSAQGQTAAHLQQVYQWVKPVVNAILGILCLIKLAQVVYKAFFSHTEFGMDLGMAIIGIVIWALFNIFANDILSMFGVTYTLQ